MIDGEEIITISPSADLKSIKPYDKSRDIEFFESDINGMDYSIKTGEYIVIEPGEAHMPCIALNGIKKVRKAVIKVQIKDE